MFTEFFSYANCCWVAELCERILRLGFAFGVVRVYEHHNGDVTPAHKREMEHFTWAIALDVLISSQMNMFISRFFSRIIDSSPLY